LVLNGKFPAFCAKVAPLTLKYKQLCARKNVLATSANSVYLFQFFASRLALFYEKNFSFFEKEVT